MKEMKTGTWAQKEKDQSENEVNTEQEWWWWGGVVIQFRYISTNWQPLPSLF